VADEASSFLPPAAALVFSPPLRANTLDLSLALEDTGDAFLAAACFLALSAARGDFLTLEADLVEILRARISC
jgi:hypothetical protein